MGKFALLGIRYDNPQQIDQSTLNWEKDLILTVNPSRLQLGRHILMHSESFVIVPSWNTTRAARLVEAPASAWVTFLSLCLPHVFALSVLRCPRGSPLCGPR